MKPAISPGGQLAGMKHFLFPAENDKAYILWGREKGRRHSGKMERSELGLLAVSFISALST